MKLFLQSDDVDIKASVVNRISDISWFKQAFGLKLLSSTSNQPSFLRDAGVKRMRLTTNEEKALGAFVKGEAYTDGIFTYHFALYEKCVALLANEEATRSCILGILGTFGLKEEKFEKRPTYYLELMGYQAEGKDYTLAQAGMDNSLKALHGKPQYVKRYFLGDDVLFAARFKKTTVLQFTSQEQLVRIYRELGISYSLDRLRARIEQLLGAQRQGVLHAKLVSGAITKMTVNRDAPDWAQTHFMMSEQAGGGVVRIELVPIAE